MILLLLPLLLVCVKKVRKRGEEWEGYEKKKEGRDEEERGFLSLRCAFFVVCLFGARLFEEFLALGDDSFVSLQLRIINWNRRVGQSTLVVIVQLL